MSLQRNQHIFTNFALFWQKNTDLVKNQHFSYQFRIVLAKEYQFGKKNNVF